MLGTGRCGSSLLAQILAAHPQVGYIPAGPDTAVLRRLTGALRALGRLERDPSEAYALLGKHVSPMFVRPFRDLTAEDAAPWLERRLRRFFDQRAHDARRPLFMHKFTGWPRARLLAAVFPEARFVHVFRDGRSVASSYMQVPWWQGYRGVALWNFGDLSERERRDWEGTNYSWVYLAGLEWQRLMEAFDAARAEIESHRWLDVRYEDLVSRPAEETTRILDFAGLERWKGLDRELERRRVSSTRMAAYRDELRPEDVALLDALLGPALQRWGYTLASDPPD